MFHLKVLHWSKLTKTCYVNFIASTLLIQQPYEKLQHLFDLVWVDKIVQVRVDDPFVGLV